MKKKYYNDLRIVLEQVTKEQKTHPLKYVTKNQVYGRIEKAFKEEAKLAKESLFSYRTMERAIDKLIQHDAVRKDGTGQYWLMNNWENSLEHKKKEKYELNGIIKDLKQQKSKLSKEKNYFEGGYNAGKHFLDALRYCDSDEDWALLEAFFVKMNRNKMEKKYLDDREELWDEEQEFNAKIMDEIEQVEAHEANQESIAEAEEQIKKGKYTRVAIKATRSTKSRK